MSPAGFERLRNSFLVRLVAIFILSAAAVTLLVCSAYVVAEVRKERRNNEAMARLAASGLAESARLPLFSGNAEELSRLVRFAAGRPGIHRAAILDASGRVLAEAARPGDVPPVTSVSVPVSAQGDRSTASPDSVLTGEPPAGSRPIGAIRIDFATPSLAGQTLRAALFAGAFALLFLALVSAVSYPVLRRAMRSFDDLLQALVAIRGGDYDRRLRVEGSSEIGIAAADVNALAESLKRREEENRALTRSLETENRERAQAEAESRESEQTLRDLTDAMPSGVGWADDAGNIQFLNRYAIETFGYGYADIRTVSDWFELACPDPEYRREILARRNKGLAAARARSGGVSSYEARITCRDGSVRHVLFSNLVRKERVVVTMLDVTEREAAQERANRAQRMETLGILAGGIAHNFNNALTSVLGYVGFARLRLGDPPKAMELLRKAEGASVAASRIATQLLTFARGGEPVKSPQSVARILADAVSLSLVGNSVEAAVRIPPDLHGVDADEGQLGQVFSNILINAVQAMQQGGKISVRCANVLPGDPPPAGLPVGPYVRIDFSDEGCGIPEEIREKIFEPYFTTHAGVGSGLGLASVRSIVEKHGGTVSVASEVGKGSTFTLHLPSTGALPPGDTPLDAPELASPRGLNLLFLDDEASIRNIAREMLEHHGHRVTTCSRGEDAVAVFREAMEKGDPFSVAVLDLTVQAGMGGKEACEAILALDPGAVLIVSSGYSNNPVMSEHRRFGFKAAVPKPYRDDTLLRAIAEAVAEGA
jgi:PAS domain S-box-containing protein